MANHTTSYAFIFRELTPEDIPSLARLHAVAWRETYERPDTPADHYWPTAELRENQWREKFKKSDGSWFCYVIEKPGEGLVGFARGEKYDQPALPAFSGELNKFYLLKRYHKLGLGRQLMGYVVNRFIRQGIGSMVLFSDPENPTGKFFEHLGGEKIFAKNGEFHGAYGWMDLDRLAAICNVK